MEDFLKDDEFAQYIFAQHYNDTDLTNEEKLMLVCSSTTEMSTALECF